MVEEETENSKFDRLSPKKVSFAVSHNVAYIYPWSPTKYLLFGKLTQEQLKRSKMESKENIISILKKPIHCDEKNIDVNFALNERNTMRRKHRKTLSFVIPDAFTDAEEPQQLAEIYVEEHSLNKSHSEVNLQTNSSNGELPPYQPVLPSMAIFSPSDYKDLITNTPYCNETNSAHTLKSIPLKGHKQQLTPLDISTVTESHEQSLTILPKITKNKLSHSFSLTRPPKYLRMPSIDSIDSLCVTSPRIKPLIKNQISERYAILENELDNIRHLNEEEFSIYESLHLKPRRPLPSLTQNIDSLQKECNSKHQHLTKPKHPKKRSKTQKLNRPGSKKIVKSCNREAQMFSPNNTPTVVPVCISSKDISSNCCK